MKEIDLSLYFDPCPFMEAANFYQDNASRLGHQVEKYTVKENFPSLEGASVVIVGLDESRGGCPGEAGAMLDKKHCNGADAVRKELYNLYAPQGLGKVVDLGNMRCGKRIEDTYFALTEVVGCLLNQKSTLVLLGGTQDLTYAVYQAYARMQKMANIVTVDARLDLAEGLGADENPLDSPISNTNYMGKMAVEPANYLFNYMNIGYQTYLVEQEAVSLMDKLYFDACRYGLLQDDIRDAEPYIRDADCVSFDLNVLKRQESPANPLARPTGFNAEQVCQLARYAGLSKEVDVVGFFEYYPFFERDNLSAQVVAEMVWCFLDAMRFRCDDHPLSVAGMEFKQYIVPFEEPEQDLVFYKCRQTDRWWMELPCSDEQRQRYGRHCYLACTYHDYETATEGNKPHRWWNAVQRIK